MFQFAHPYFLYLLILIPILIVWYFVMRIQRRKALQRFGEEALLEQLTPDVSVQRSTLKFGLMSGAILIMAFMLAGPQFGKKLETVKRKGIELIIALDVSNSMMAEDITPSRLERSKQLISRIVDKLSNDRIGLIVFAGDAYVQLPVTTDYVSAKLFLSSISTKTMPVQGTAIGKAIDLSVKSFGPDNKASRAVIVITDGENHEDNAVDAAKKAIEKGVVIHTVGMGLPQGSPIPEAGTNNFLKDRQGNVVISKLNESSLIEIAEAGNGLYTRATNSQSSLNPLFSKIEDMEKTEFESKVYSEFDEQFQWIAFIVFAILFIELFILERKNKYLRHINIFERKSV